LTCSAGSPRRFAPAVLALLAAAALLPAGGCASTDAGSSGPPLAAVEAESLINLSLSPRWSQWLVGPVAVLASPQEEAAFLALTEDAAAEAFIDDFWERRKPYPERPDNPLREEFEQRAQVADRLYSEGGRLGSHTARGTIYVLFGKPPAPYYRFIKRGQITEFYRARTGIEQARPVRPEELP
jgi:GWxTD domain-containing protein